ncbi:MAG TPA: hypothetical protein VLV18_01360 [Terriglobales bacterium]|nr:hypothetical protein [Terriglobales bacterium]
MSLLPLALQIPSLGTGGLAIFIILVIIGIILIMILATVIHFILPIIAAVIVWFVTGSLIYAGVAFLAVAILQMLATR